MAECVKQLVQEYESFIEARSYARRRVNSQKICEIESDPPDPIMFVSGIIYVLYPAEFE